MIRLRVNVSEQMMHVEKNGSVLKTYPVSTSKFGTGMEEGSKKTPLGNFVVSEKIGGDQPINTIFKGRKPVGIWDYIKPGEDMILSRILWLDGIDPENSNTKDRFIYIHGTDQENLIGTPASHGCVRMLNENIVELFDLISIGTPVSIIRG